MLSFHFNYKWFRFMRGENQGFDSETQKNRHVACLLKWCHVSESNQGHRDFQSLALPTELTWHIYSIIIGVGRACSTSLTPLRSTPLRELTWHICHLLTKQAYQIKFQSQLDFFINIYFINCFFSKIILY